MKLNKKAGIKIGIFFGIFILLVSPVLAVSVSAPHMPDNQLNLLIGETKDLTFVLQNGGGATEAVTLKAEIIEGGDIARITDSSNLYIVSPGDKIDVNLVINVPDDAELGETNRIKLQFTTVTASGSGSFAFGSSIGQEFEVVIVEEVLEASPEEAVEGTLVFVIIIVLVVAILVISFFVIKRRKRSNILTATRKGTVKNLN